MRTILPLLMLAPALRADDFFAAKVRPILAAHCFKCHGPDDATRKARLRLDTREDAVKPARSKKRAIVPGKPAESEAVARIESADGTEMMPPPSAKMPLSAEQKRILREWIAKGAEYTTHWAFVAPMKTRPPAVADSGGSRPRLARNPIDTFVLARLEREKLKPSPQADRLTLLRRVSLDLVGLPPTPEEADAFLADTRPDAYERLVDRLLASPAYGERWARKWLDLARYADTNGYEKDRPRSIWPWRDWVIRSINDNLPFDRFSVEQLAGDMLPRPVPVATGFHRNTMLNEEGGIDPLEFRFHAMTDRVATTGTVWLGLTLGCVQCHTHKYDPLSHREYYSLMAYLNNADEVTADVPDEATTARRREARRRVAEAEAGLAAKFPGGEKAREAAFTKWHADEEKRASCWHTLRPAKATSNLPLLTVEGDDAVFVSGDQSKADTYELSFDAPRAGLTALRLEALADARLPAGGPGRVSYEGPHGDFFLSEITVLADGVPVKLASASHSFAGGGSSAAAALDGNKQTGWSVNGRQGRDSYAVFRLAEPLREGVKTLTVRLLCERYYAAGLGRLRLRATSDASATARDLPLDADDELRAERPTARLREIHLLAAPELAKERAAIDALRKAVPAYPTTLVFKERPPHAPRPTHLHHRGEFLQPKDKVEPGLPAALGTPKGMPKDRLAFARWLFTAESPLTARVTANRHWAAFFGTGLVKTQEDFGTQGELPSHPDLLDWLAVELREGGWDIKALHRLIVTSATYRQSSAMSAALREKDPANRLLARGPRLRLEAEQLRDAVLSASGLLHMKIGGPSVFPPQPASVTTEGAYGRLDWKPSPGLDRYRRGLYTFIKRTTPFAMSATFDGPSGEVCVARREVTNTALQALTMLNDQVILEAAQELGRWAVAERVGVDRLFRRILSREPTPMEAQQIAVFFAVRRNRIRDAAIKPEDKKALADAAALAGPGDAKTLAERAAWVALARVLFNLDEFIVRG